MVAHRLSPPTRYDEAGDLIPYWRKDGQRPILWTDKVELFNKDKVRNYLREQEQKLFVDYIICSDFQDRFEDIARELGIPSLTYAGDGLYGSIQRWAVQAFSAVPTSIVFFYSDPMSFSIRELNNIAKEKDVKREWVSW